MSETGAGFSGVEDLLAAARAGLERLSAPEAAAAVADGARLVDIRPAWQRARDGEISGALVVERNHLEWRLHPRSAARLRWAQPGQRWIVVCAEGFTSSLAAASLRSIGVDATDLIGGIRAWQAAGLPLVAGPSRVEQVVGTVGNEAGVAAALLPPEPSARADQPDRRTGQTDRADRAG
ncbi:rhodanese-like domain-containing protein [Jatrophihabitans sp.]|jgi:rhodanese-related sulfurtransferase|uniref:rhodanese-like domain-containing protein n=1 Tax=Jatrophihabitans sp. TaxID=1932789 RepID=UPI002F0F6D49